MVGGHGACWSTKNAAPEAMKRRKGNTKRKGEEGDAHHVEKRSKGGSKTPGDARPAVALRRRVTLLARGNRDGEGVE